MPALSRARRAAILLPLVLSTAAFPLSAIAQPRLSAPYRQPWPSGPGGVPSGKKLNVNAVVEALRSHNDAALKTPASIKMTPLKDQVAPKRPVIAVENKPAVALLRLLSAASDGKPPVVLVEKFATGPLLSSGPILERELARQSILIALREELGLVTRDGLLGESASAPSDVSPLLEIEIDFRPGTKRQLTLRKPSDPAAPPLAQLMFSAWDEIEYPKFLAELEGLTRDKLPAVLKDRNIPQATPSRWNADAPLDPAIESLIQTLSLYTQFEAIRRVHASIRKDGESRAALDALIRAYANLAVLSEFHWTAAHKAMLARSLLYAERLAVKDKKSPDSLRLRAYAYALAGRHQQALDDLATAAAVPGQNPKNLPPWVDVINAVCRFDIPALEKLSEHETAGSLASLFHCIAIEGPSTLALSMKVGRSALRKNPECFRIADRLCAIAGVSDGHQVTVLAPAYFYKSVNDRLRAIQNLPKTVLSTLPEKPSNDAADDQQAETTDADRWKPQDTLAALRAAPDSEEFSWSALGSLLEETQFVQLWRRVHFLRFQYGLGADEYLDAMRPLFENHPYRQFLEAHALAGPELRSAVDQFVNTLDAPHVELFHEPTATRLLWDVGREYYTAVQGLARRNADYVHSDQVYILGDTTTLTSTNPNVLMGISPHSNFGRYYFIRRSANLKKLSEMFDDANGDPIVLAALGERFKQLGAAEEAEKCLEQIVEISPDYTAFRELGELYKKREEMTKWREVMDRYINEGHQDLMTAKAQTEIAEWLMTENKLDEAAEYADSAAESWAQWAILSALQVAKAQHNYEKAHMYVERLLQRYPCEEYLLEDLKISLRRSREDFQRAAAAARPLVLKMSTALQQDIFTPATFLLLLDEHAKALELYRKIFTAFPGEHEKVYTAFYVLLLEDQLAHAAERDEQLSFIASTTSRRESKSRELAKLFQAACAEGGSLDLAACDKILADGEQIDRVNLNYFVGFFLQNRRRDEEARPYLIKAVELDPAGYYLSTLLALRELQRKGIPIPEPEMSEQTEPAQLP